MMSSGKMNHLKIQTPKMGKPPLIALKIEPVMKYQNSMRGKKVRTR